MTLAGLLYLVAFAMLLVFAAVIYFLREKRLAMLRDMANEYLMNREKKVRLLASAKNRSRHRKEDGGVIVDPISAMFGLEVTTQFKTRR